MLHRESDGHLAACLCLRRIRIDMRERRSGEGEHADGGDRCDSDATEMHVVVGPSVERSSGVTQAMRRMGRVDERLEAPRCQPASQHPHQHESAQLQDVVCLADRRHPALADVDRRSHSHRQRQRGHDWQNPERSHRPPRHVQQTDRHGSAERAEMSGVVDRCRALAQNESGGCEREFGRGNHGQRDAHPLASAGSGRMRSGQHRAGDVWHRLGDTDAQHPVDAADVIPPRAARRAVTEMCVRSGRLGRAGLLIK